MPEGWTDTDRIEYVCPICNRVQILYIWVLGDGMWELFCANGHPEVAMEVANEAANEQ